ncbi:MAG: sigma-70 family RNA polymerase sigma factor [Bacteroidaceae bacterium]|jgi:RNA polymerase sigma-70 factor (ECF subfamily)|nr:sigma-70 family RNA polymerase sigma factor [Bacteroidaceae bacterium]
MKKLHELADEELVSLYSKGNNNAFDTLLKRYESKVFSYLLYSVKNQEIAEDLFQDVFIKMIVRLKNGQYTENGKFSSWMMRIVHNHLIDYYRTSVTDKVLSNDATETDLYSKADIVLNENCEQEMINRQTLEEVRSLIALLPESQRKVLFMRIYEEMSFKEIAQKTNCSINTALGRMRYAILNLRHMAYERGISMAS